MDALSQALVGAAVAVTCIAVAAGAGFVWLVISAGHRWRQMRMRTAHRAIESVYVCDNLASPSLTHRFSVWLSPFGSHISAAFAEETEQCYRNSVVTAEYPKMVIHFEASERVQPGHRLLVEVSRDCLTGDILQIVPAGPSYASAPETETAAH